jgi:hypothetical protein
VSITPADLQTLFSQIDKIAKDVHAQKEGAQLHRNIETALHQKIELEKARAVNETDDAGEGPDKLKDQKNSEGGGASGQKKKPDGKEDCAPAAALVEVRDPNLGKYLDIEG